MAAHQLDEPVAPPKPADSTADDAAVDDIEVHDADAILAAEDAVQKAFEPDQQTGWWQKLKHWFHVWWDNPKLRYGSLAGLAALVIILFSLPPSRYFILNNVGVRSSASLTVLDQTTQQPLKHVQVELAGQSAQTNDQGQVTLQHLKLGNSKLVITRRAFATVNQTLTIGWGSNPLGNFSLKPTGSQYTFMVTDFLSGQPQTQAEANAGSAEANADSKGKIVLTVDPKDNPDNLQVTITAQGYRDETVTISPDDKSVHNVAMVPAQKHVFVSRKSGKYDLYSVDVDGKNQRLLLAATGYERSDMAIIPESGANIVAVVSTRDNAHDSQGYLLSTLSLISTKDGQKTDVTQAEKVQVLGWLGSRVIYVQVAAGASAANPKREQLMSYDTADASRDMLATSNYFNDVVIADGSVYYAPSDAYQANAVGFEKIAANGTGHQTLLPLETWNILRDSYNHFNLSVGQNWYGYTFKATAPTKSNGAPASQNSRLYLDSTNGKNSLWVDSRDGKGVLLNYDVAAKTDKTLVAQSGLTYPLYWLNDSDVVYRVQTDQETADYVVSTNGGNPHKIADVTNTAGVTRWYYY